ncbi:MAG: hypothetical protein HKN12_07080, partial [Gemmatimonadetes bacterium]|nr:hypothetical protein [Gemmatimonadota bacterium]
MLKRFLNRKVILPAAMLLTVANLNGCFSETSTGPDAATSEAPALPAPENMTFDFGFFDQGATMQREAGRENFVNAYLRVVIVSAVVDLMLAPPIHAFALALHTPPSLQDDGSWIWV